MAKIKYAFGDDDKVKTAKAIGRSLRISPKHAVEICRQIRGMQLEDAKDYLNRIIRMEEPLPFKRHNKKIAHRRGIKGWPSGRYPVKAATQMLAVLEGAEANAEYKGLDTENLKIAHISSHKGTIMKGWTPRAFGRASPFNTPTTHIQIVLEEA